MTRKKTKRGSGFGVLFWMAFILFVVALYLHNRTDIQQVLENTGLVETLTERLSSETGDEPEVESGSETDPEGEPDSGGGSVSETLRETPETPQIELIPDDGLQQEDSDAPAAAESTNENGRDTAADDTSEVAGEDSSSESEMNGESPATAGTRSRDFPLYFIRVTDEGTIYPDRVLREVSFVDSPLTAMLQILIRGPNSQEIERGLHHLIPDDTKLISASVRGGVAYLNFNEAFQFNPLGVEGYMAQLKQVVYSTTEFPTVDAVQILIEGQEREFLGGDGVYIGKPLHRDSFG
ncbi:MAG: GerMN domain-containing protein [Spirochaeta sp.]|nr:GerMN domain-containing protein [Spirochaeta sp.]